MKTCTKTFSLLHARLPALLLAMTFVLLPLATTAPALAQVDTFEFATDEQQQRFRRLSNELRCPMCQNTNLSGSPGGVAEDLRREIHRMIMEGHSDDEIKQFMFERYGDFIFYRPRLRTATILLWFGPLLFLLAGAAIGYSIARRAQAQDDGKDREGIDAIESLGESIESSGKL